MVSPAFRKTILIVEDEASILRLLADQSREAGFAVLTAADGMEGLNTALTAHPDIILLDILMPKMDGLTMLKKLRADPYGKTVPVIILTNMSYTDSISRALEGGVYDYLMKSDWSLEAVLNKVKERVGVSS